MKISKKVIIDNFIMRTIIFFLLLISIQFSVMKFNLFKFYNIAYNVWLVLYIIVAVILPLFDYIFWTYNITDKFIEVKFGIIFKRTICVPIDRIKYIDLVQNPISKVLKINKIKIYTAGGKVIIPGVHSNIARKICDIIKETN